MKKYLLFTLFIFAACANKNCREVRMEQEKKQNPAAQLGAAAPELAQVGPQARVKVFKYDGSKQCGMGESTPVDKMQKELKEIKVYMSGNQPDGLMHIQACGTPTGKANVYEIDQKDLAEAKKLGFKEWVY